MQPLTTSIDKAIEVRKTQLISRNKAKNDLFNAVQKKSFSEIINVPELKEGAKALLLAISKDLTPLAIYETKAPNLGVNCRDKLSRDLICKMIGAVIKNHVDSIENLRKMSEFDILECCVLILEKFPNEKFDDLVLAFKQDKLAGTKYWSGFGSQEVFALLNAYFESKAIAEEQFRVREQSQFKQQLKTSDLLQGVVDSDNPIAQKMKANIKDMSNQYKNTFLPAKMPNLEDELATLRESVSMGDIEDLQQLHASCLVIGLKPQTEIIEKELQRRQSK